MSLLKTIYFGSAFLLFLAGLSGTGETQFNSTIGLLPVRQPVRDAFTIDRDIQRAEERLGMDFFNPQTASLLQLAQRRFSDLKSIDIGQLLE